MEILSKARLFVCLHEVTFDMHYDLSNHQRCQKTEAARSNIAPWPRHARERKCANTIGTVSVPWAGHFHFPMLKY